MRLTIVGADVTAANSNETSEASPSQYVTLTSRAPGYPSSPAPLVGANITPRHNGRAANVTGPDVLVEALQAAMQVTASFIAESWWETSSS